MTQYLLVYRRSTGRLDQLEDLSSLDPTAVLRKRFAVELRERKDPDVEVVVLSASSLDALKRTHSRYFKTSQDLATAIVEALPE